MPDRQLSIVGRVALQHSPVSPSLRDPNATCAMHVSQGHRTVHRARQLHMRWSHPACTRQNPKKTHTVFSSASTSARATTRSGDCKYACDPAQARLVCVPAHHSFEPSQKPHRASHSLTALRCSPKTSRLATRRLITGPSPTILRSSPSKASRSPVTRRTIVDGRAFLFLNSVYTCEGPHGQRGRHEHARHKTRRSCIGTTARGRHTASRTAETPLCRSQRGSVSIEHEVALTGSSSMDVR